jgi:hypothetical protein
LVQRAAADQHWSKENGTPSIRDRISRDEYERVWGALCAVEPTPDAELTDDEKNAKAADRFYLITPFVNAINAGWRSALVPSQRIALDEAMIKQRGVHKAVMHMQKKPIRFGFKAYATATVQGYTIEHRLYAGKTDDASGVGLTERIVHSMLVPFVGRNHIVAFDSFYTSVRLCEGLLRSGLMSVGSINPTRRYFASELANAKPATDEFETCQLVQTPAVVAIVHANYKRTKHYLSTATAVTGGTIATVDRALGKKTKKKPVLVPGAVRPAPRLHPTPSPVMLYNSVMGGVDVANNLAARNSLWHMSKDWWRTIFLHYVNVSIVNAWYLYRWYGADDLPFLTPRQFRTALATELMDEYVGRRVKGRPPKRPRGAAVHRQVKTTETQADTTAGPDKRRTKQAACVVCFSRPGKRGEQEQRGRKSIYMCENCGVYVCDSRKHPCWRKHCELGVESAAL